MTFQKHCKAHVVLDDMVLIYQFTTLLSHYLHELKKIYASEKRICTSSLLTANENEAGFHRTLSTQFKNLGKYQQRLFHNTGTFFLPSFNKLSR